MIILQYRATFWAKMLYINILNSNITTYEYNVRICFLNIIFMELRIPYRWQCFILFHLQKSVILEKEKVAAWSVRQRNVIFHLDDLTSFYFLDLILSSIVLLWWASKGKEENFYWLVVAVVLNISICCLFQYIRCILYI
jgi:hypothetical protein